MRDRRFTHRRGSNCWEGSTDRKRIDNRWPSYNSRRRNDQARFDSSKLDKESPSIDEQELTAPRLFGTNGIRGVVGETITAEFAYGIGSNLASLFKDKKIVLGRDGRTSSQMLAEAAVTGILAQGSSVEDCGVITTPGLQFLSRISALPGLVITASHNPPEYNGFKVVDTD